MLGGDEDPDVAATERSADSQRRLKLTCPQQPGVVLAITELLKDFDCKMSKIDADTVARGSEIWFEIEAIVNVPGDQDVARVEDNLRFWVAGKPGTSLVFDSFTHGFSPLSHA